MGLCGSYQETHTGSPQGKTFKLSELSTGCLGLGVEEGGEFRETGDDEAEAGRLQLQTPCIRKV